MPYGSKGPSNGPTSGPTATPVPVNRRLPAPASGSLPMVPATPSNQGSNSNRQSSSYNMPTPAKSPTPAKKDTDHPFLTGVQNDTIEKARSLAEAQRALHGPEIKLRTEVASTIYEVLSEVLRGYILSEYRAQIANDLAETISHMSTPTWEMIEEATIRTIDWSGRAIPRDVQTETLERLKAVFS